MLSILRSITVSSVALIFLASSFCSTAKQSPKPRSSLVLLRKTKLKTRLTVALVLRTELVLSICLTLLKLWIMS